LQWGTPSFGKIDLANLQFSPALGLVLCIDKPQFLCYTIEWKIFGRRLPDMAEEKKKSASYGEDSISALKGEQRIREKPASVLGSDGLEGCESS
jgi:hypothetical protein